MGLLSTLRIVARHPLNADRPWRGLLRLLRWQLGARLVPGPVAVPLVDQTRLLVSPGMTGATGNIYCGLFEFEDMALVLHGLRPEDLFVDVGANIGVYSVLASGVADAQTLAFEPIPATYALLQRNLRVNGLESRVEALALGLGAQPGVLHFTAGLDTVNHVAAASDGQETQVEVPVQTLDSVLDGRVPRMIKIDVEGWETEVLAGAQATLAAPGLQVVLLELAGSGQRYGFDEDLLHQKMLDLGFEPCSYDPFLRELLPCDGQRRHTGNTLYVRDRAELSRRLRAARRFTVQGRAI